MTVGELKEMLEDLDEDIEVRLAMQPAWPFEYDIASLEVIEGEITEEVEEEGLIPETVVYLVEGTQIGYLPSYVAKELGWER